MDMTAVRRFATLTMDKRRLESELDAVKKEMADLNERLVDDFAGDGVANVSIPGHTLALRRDVRAYPIVPAEEACRALRDAGYVELVRETYNVQTVWAVFREFDRGDIPIPPALDKAFRVDEIYTVRATANNKKELKNG